MIGWLMACGGPEVDVPPGTVLATVEPDGVRIGEALVPTKALEADPTKGEEAALVAAFTALPEAAGAPLRVDVPADLPFWKLRRVASSARVAGLGEAAFRVAGTREVVALPRPAKFALGGRCEPDSLAVKGAEPLVTLSIQSGPDGAWVVASATFLPVLEKGPVEGHDPACLVVPPCDALFPAGPLRAACESGGPRRVALGGEYGCALPIAKAPPEVAEWRAGMPQLAERLGLADQQLLVVMPEARIRADALAALLLGLADAGVGAPVGMGSLVEGNDGPPVCSATVRDRDGFAAAAAAWLGGVGAANRKEDVDGAP